MKNIHTHAMQFCFECTISSTKMNAIELNSNRALETD